MSSINKFIRQIHHRQGYPCRLTQCDGYQNFLAKLFRNASSEDRPSIHESGKILMSIRPVLKIELAFPNKNTPQTRPFV